MGWFKRIQEGITTSTNDKKEIPEGLWYQCRKCKNIVPSKDHEENLYLCPKCDHHERINAKEYFEFLFDGGKFLELDPKMTACDPLGFVDSKPYKKRLVDTKKKTGLKDALTSGYGMLDGKPIVIACMNFNFIGGSMGAVVGEKISRAIQYAIKENCTFMMISKSGGARMMEAAYSLMQMAKTSANLYKLSEAKIPYISFLTDPTTGGVTASYAMLGDVNISEPGALIGFAGPRVVKETIGKDLPKDFQTSEFVLEHGFLDFIVNRKKLKPTISTLIDAFNK
jgi:acetyl-CoA carboxylase carboxyl transferase subunit beta